MIEKPIEIILHKEMLAMVTAYFHAKASGVPVLPEMDRLILSLSKPTRLVIPTDGEADK